MDKQCLQAWHTLTFHRTHKENRGCLASSRRLVQSNCYQENYTSVHPWGILWLRHVWGFFDCVDAHLHYFYFINYDLQDNYFLKDQFSVNRFWYLKHPIVAPRGCNAYCSPKYKKHWIIMCYIVTIWLFLTHVQTEHEAGHKVKGKTSGHKQMQIHPKHCQLRWSWLEKQINQSELWSCDSESYLIFLLNYCSLLPSYIHEKSVDKIDAAVQVVVTQSLHSALMVEQQQQQQLHSSVGVYTACVQAQYWM